MENCIFCKIAHHEIPGKILYEDDLCMAFMDLSQTTDGHTLVIPKIHADHFLDVDEKTLAHMMKVTQDVTRMIQKSLHAKGFNIVSNMNEVAGQSVKHFHIHIIPRYSENDTFDIHYTDRSDRVHLDDIYQKIKEKH